MKNLIKPIGVLMAVNPIIFALLDDFWRMNDIGDFLRYTKEAFEVPSLLFPSLLGLIILIFYKK